MIALRMLNVTLRGATLAGKLALVFFLAKLLSPEEVGHYGLLAATLGWLIYLVGCEFYAFSTRDLIGRDAPQVLGLLRNQGILFAITHVAVWPFVLFAFYSDLLPGHYWPWFILLLALEHLGLELGRMLVALSRPVTASFVLFLRGGAWCIVAAAAMWLVPALRSLDFLFAAWFVGALAALVLGMVRLLELPRSSLRQPIDWRWIAVGLRTSLPLMVASLAVRGIFTIDRFWADALGGPATLGAYVLFVGLAMAVLSFLDAAVIDFAYPRIVATVKSGRVEDYFTAMKGLAMSVVISVLVLCAGCWVTSLALVYWLDNPTYSKNAFLLPWILLATAIYGISMIPHVGLYARGQDKVIIFSQLAALAAFVIIATLGSGAGISIVPFALVGAFTLLLVWKSIAFWFTRRQILADAALAN